MCKGGCEQYGGNSGYDELEKLIREREAQTPLPSRSQFRAAIHEFRVKRWPAAAPRRRSEWRLGSRGSPTLALAAYEQYRHLSEIAEALEEHPQLKTVIGNDYMIAPDIVIGRNLVDDATI